MRAFLNIISSVLVAICCLTCFAADRKIVPANQIICPIQLEKEKPLLLIRAIILFNSYLPIGNYSICKIDNNGIIKYLLTFVYSKKINKEISTGSDGEIILKMPMSTIDIENFYYSDGNNELKINVGTKETWDRIVTECKKKNEGKF